MKTKSLSLILFFQLSSLLIVAQEQNALSTYKSELKNEKIKKVPIEKSFSKDTTIYLFNKDSQLSSLFVSGYIKLGSRRGYVRITLTDSDGIDYLVYESYYLTNSSFEFSFHDEFEETGVLEDIIPISLTLHITDASVKMSDVSITEGFKDKNGKIKSIKSELIAYKQEQKIENLNKRIEMV